MKPEKLNYIFLQDNINDISLVVTEDQIDYDYNEYECFYNGMQIGHYYAEDFCLDNDADNILHKSLKEDISNEFNINIEDFEIIGDNDYFYINTELNVDLSAINNFIMKWRDEFEVFVKCDCITYFDGSHINSIILKDETHYINNDYTIIDDNQLINKLNNAIEKYLNNEKDEDFIVTKNNNVSNFQIFDIINNN